MGLKVELIRKYKDEVIAWQVRKNKALERASNDFGLILPLVEEYYDASKPVGDRVVFSWEVVRGEDGMRRFLDAYMFACRQFPESEIKITR